MDIATRVDYEFLYDLDLRDPVTDEKIGVSMKIRSAGSDAAKKVLRAHTNKNLERRVKGKLPKSEQMEKEELEKAASYIASWDWGKNTYEGEKPELSMKRAAEIMEKQGWIFGQVVEAANKIANFSPASQKASVKK